MSLIKRLLSREFEFQFTLPQASYYTLERKLSHMMMQRSPPTIQSPNFLNLGCGPHIYEGWVNADDYAPKRRLREQSFKPNWLLDITREWKCDDNHWDGIFTEHVIEHVTYAEAVFVFGECYRTMKPGAWIRISVPSLSRYVSYYRGEISDSDFIPFPSRALALSFLTQMHMHKSTWDGELMTTILGELGFTNAKEVAYRSGSDQRLLKDDPHKARESLYVEAQKPTA